MDGQAPEPLDPDDVVERELDVFLLNNDLAKLETQLAVLQYPLRPPWRPYDPATAARYKRQARRLELDVPIDTTSENYNLDADKTKRVEQQTLRCVCGRGGGGGGVLAGRRKRHDGVCRAAHARERPPSPCTCAWRRLH